MTCTLTLQHNTTALHSASDCHNEVLTVFASHCRLLFYDFAETWPA